jgi:DNA-binding XRE family transcriptional regulator
MHPDSHADFQRLLTADTASEDEPLYDVRQRAFFGRALRVLRPRMQVSQDALGAIVGLSADEIARIEAGELAPSLWRAVDLATFFDTTVEAMCGRGTLPASTDVADEDEDDDL